MSYLINPYLFGGTLGLYQELGRTKLTSTGDVVTVNLSSSKPYLMVLWNTIASGTCSNKFTFNNDTTPSYAARNSGNGGADGTNTSEANVALNYTSDDNYRFGYFFTNNITDEEKLSIGHTNQASGTGSGNVPNRNESFFKWVNTSAQISRVDMTNDKTGNYAIDTEMVVLGYDPADTSGDSVWEELASVELTGSSDTIDSGTITAKKYLWIEAFTQATGGITGDALRFNSDSSSVYSQRKSVDGGSDSTATSNRIAYDATGSSNDKFTSAYIINVADEEKLVTGELNQRNSSGSGSAPRRSEFVGKWANTSNSITSVQIVNLDAGDFAIGSTLKVWGFD